ncbi:MAG TPA: hypothetical protein VHU14_10000 [Solirubrobacterales bacterium]|jgi:hypothetical protein|nr:hypothetical protein [Solirubrobacterales bacterium]
MGAKGTAAIDTTPVDLSAAVVIEAAEARAWADLYAAAPAEFAAAAGLGSVEVGGALVLRWAASGRRYFSRTIGLGVAAPATPVTLDEILDHYRACGIEMFLLQSLPRCRPAGYEGWLRDRGLEPFDAQDRIVRGSGPPGVAPPPLAHRELVVERVGPATADEWAEFLQRVYRLDTGTWLQALIGRAGWGQYVAREGGEIVAARGMFIGPDGIAWLGMDGPVPGITTEDHEPDAAICATIVADGLGRGVRRFIADIEAPTAEMDTPAYGYFSQLGFSRPYVRTHYARI